MMLVEKKSLSGRLEVIGEILRGAKAPLSISSPSPLKERGIKGVRSTYISPGG